MRQRLIYTIGFMCASVKFLWNFIITVIFLAQQYKSWIFFHVNRAFANEEKKNPQNIRERDEIVTSLRNRIIFCEYN